MCSFGWTGSVTLPLEQREECFEKIAKQKGATKINSEEIYDWNIDFFLKAGYKVSGALDDFPKGHTYYLIEKDL